MPRGIPLEEKERAEELYVVGGRSLRTIAEVTGISRRTLEYWSADEGWGERKRAYRRALAEIRRNTVELRRRLIAKALKSLDPQDVYAVSRLEAAAAKALAEDAAAPDVTVGKVRDIRTPEDAVSALEDAIQSRLNAMLSRPETVSLAGVRDMKKALDLCRDLKAAAPDEKKRGLSDDVVEDIKRRILGIS